MPGTRRLVSVDLAMHITCRGNNKQAILKREEDKLCYYKMLFDFKEENSIDIFHYCLMDNHIHLVVWLNIQSNLSRLMKQINLSYFQYYNKKYGYVGHLWQGRFKSRVIADDPYLLQCGKYIELNPVRAGIVKSPEEYKFSSYNHYAYGQKDLIVTSSPAYLALADCNEARRKRYVEFVVDSTIGRMGKRSP